MQESNSWFRVLLAVSIVLASSGGWANEKIMLWPSGAPGAVGNAETDQPNLTLYAPPADQLNGTAIVVCPGGGYQHLAVGHEGEEIGQWLNSLGVTAFVLRYRLAPAYKHPTPMLDVQRALRTVRSRAAEWKLDPQKIGVLGFSAGGHLASTAATHFDGGDVAAADPIDRVSCRPDFAVLCYPVITFQDDVVTHRGSRKNLLGEQPDPQLVALLSNDTQVTDQTPPVFLWHTTEDKGVKPENSVRFYLACVKAGVPVELHLYEKGPHGIGLAKKHRGTDQWPVACAGWLKLHGWLSP
ncbi:alpha/beta hydrolase [Schlesneria paludicola]|uniref:alpha/beta hydrolase n=1 Tax=Schlesneria paludicola TaxID=360056 RepID=UPI00029AF4E6|nr:alpha/beta hydrolase [Schlesneria paludicola]